MIKRIEEKMKNEIPAIELYTINLIMDIQHLHALIDVVNIPAAYLLLRNLLENFVKLFIYLDLGKSINPNITLSLMFLYEYEANEKLDQKKRRIYSLRRFKDEMIRKFFKNSLKFYIK
ncbi:MAG: hypothetical protein QXI58_03465 [Candidatus Micrarchaeia archaeon]